MLITTGTSGTTYSYPDEQIGYSASELYVSRSQQNTPNSLAKTVTNTSQPALESPLRKASFPADDTIPAEVRRGRLSVSSRPDDQDASESEQEQEVHVEPLQRYNKVTGGEESMNETEPARPYISHPTEEDDYLIEHGYSVPILAADEVAKEVGIEHLQPAVSPKQERRGSTYELENQSGDITPSSRPSSRPSSVYGPHSASYSLSRFISQHEERENVHTPLEDVAEYEPLFPEDDDSKRPMSHAERFKQRPHTLRQRFPSQDIWEDTPSSALYSATVSTPDLPAQAEKPASKTFKPAEQEAARKEEPSEEERQKLVPKDDRLAKSRFAPHLRDDMPTRPGMVPRFPSSDIWEDSPESHQLVTTVSSPPVDPEPQSPEASTKPGIPPRPAVKSRLGEGASSAQIAPSVPARPQKTVHAVPPLGAPLADTTKTKGVSTSPTESKKTPSIPDRPKPLVPARPAKKASGEGLTKSISGESAGAGEPEKALPPIAKVKPQIPAKPGQGSKIASLRGNFMNDLNQKLGLGPPKEKEAETAEETKPLEDARKGRARGPQRRAPAKSPAAPIAKSAGLSMSIPRALWTIDDTDELNVTSSESTEPASFKLEDAPTVAGISDQKAEQIENSTPADAPLPPTIEATDHTEEGKEREAAEANDEPAPLATRIATNTAGELVEPTLGTPTQERSNPLSKTNSSEPENEEGRLSQRTTASSAQASGPELEREHLDLNIDASPVSKQPTASTDEDIVSSGKSPSVESKTLAAGIPEGEPGKASAEQV